MRDPNGTFRVVFTRAGGGASRAVRYVNEQPGWLTKAALLALVFAVGVLAFVLLVPLILLALLAFFVLALVGWVRSKISRAHDPNGPLDGRKNVRVITRNSAPPPVDSGG